MERFNQLGYTIAEAVISGVYITPLLAFLKVKFSVRQRRVMLDLKFVKAVVIALDLLELVLVWLNLNGLSHPVQTSPYVLKFRLDLAVLNQLMAAAARGIYGEIFGEKRYCHPSVTDKSCPSRPSE